MPGRVEDGGFVRARAMPAAIGVVIRALSGDRPPEKEFPGSGAEPQPIVYTFAYNHIRFQTRERSLRDMLREQ